MARKIRVEEIPAQGGAKWVKARLTAGAPRKRIEYRDAAAPGLYLVHQPSGKASWAFRYRSKSTGKVQKLTLGPVLAERNEKSPGIPAIGTAMTLGEAHRVLQRVRGKIADGLDPAAEKRTVRARRRSLATTAAVDTVRKWGERFVEGYAKPRNRSWAEVERQFKAEINPVWGEREVAAISKTDVKELLVAIRDRTGKRPRKGVTANRVLATLHVFFDWLIEEKGVLTDNPCDGVKRPVREESRARTLSDDEIRLFWKATEGFGHPFGPMWRLLLLTGQRRGEIAGMRSDELVLDGAQPLWTIPGARTKNKKVHLVPLAPEVVAIIEKLPKIGTKGLLFTTTGDTSISGFSRSKGRLDAKMLELLQEQADPYGDKAEVAAMEPFTLHDLRRTMVTRMNEHLQIPPHVVEAVVNHTSGLAKSGVAGVYNRALYLAERREALEKWAAYLVELSKECPETHTA